ncbi:MAG: hypothetical protein ACRENB_11245 [Gemmatimonadales bacterium]
MDAQTPDAIPAVAPDSTPAWFSHDSSWTADRTLKRILTVRFKAGVTLAAKKAALDSVGGLVVGGYHLSNDPDGVYYIYVPRAHTDSLLLVARATLYRQPSVRRAGFELNPSPSGVRPVDGTGWQKVDWTFHPDSAFGENWSFVVVQARASLVVDAQTPAGIPAVAPDSTPAWFSHDSSWAADRTLKRVLTVRFKAGVSLAAKKAALDSVGGLVVGGYHLINDPDGVYFIYVSTAHSDALLLNARATLLRQSSVRRVGLRLNPSVSGVRPVNGTGWQKLDWSDLRDGQRSPSRK